MTAAAKRHLARIHTLRCIVCAERYGVIVPATQAHHIESVRGDHSAYATVPLCDVCHAAMHEHRRRAFYLAHKLDDVKLLAYTIKELEELLL